MEAKKGYRQDVKKKWKENAKSEESHVTLNSKPSLRKPQTKTSFFLWGILSFIPVSRIKRETHSTTNKGDHVIKVE